jgi:hypothetical protein
MTEVPKIVYDRLRAAQKNRVVPDGALLDNEHPDSGHPDADLLTAFAERTLSAAERDATLEHLALCNDCRDGSGASYHGDCGRSHCGRNRSWARNTGASENGEKLADIDQLAKGQLASAGLAKARLGSAGCGSCSGCVGASDASGKSQPGVGAFREPASYDSGAASFRRADSIGGGPVLVDHDLAHGTTSNLG